MTDNIAAGSATPSNSSNNEASVTPATSTISVATATQHDTLDPIPQTASEPEQPSDPRIAALKAMFPDYDDLVLLSVLDSVGGNQDSAIDMLLAMSDPNYKSEPPAASQPEAQPRHTLTQEELDEQFARSLVIQEQQEQQAWTQANQGNQIRPTVYQSGRTNQTWGPPAQSNSPQSTQADKTMQDIQEQFTKIAETGKKTFGSIFSKVKAKLQELDQGRPIPSSSNSERERDQIWSPPSAAPVAPNVQSNAAYYDPNPTTIEPQRPIAASPPRTVPPITSANKGYDIGDDPPIPDTFPSPGLKAAAPSPPTEPTGAGPSPPTTSAGPPFDAGKFGLLPKKPVSLLPQSTAASGTVSSSGYESDDDLEYAENPFDDAPNPSTPAAQPANNHSDYHNDIDPSICTLKIDYEEMRPEDHLSRFIPRTTSMMPYDPFVPNFARVVNEMVHNRLKEYAFSKTVTTKAKPTKSNQPSTVHSKMTERRRIAWGASPLGWAAKKGDLDDKTSMLSAGSTLID